jgi:hypothetical protein
MTSYTVSMEFGKGKIEVGNIMWFPERKRILS